MQRQLRLWPNEKVAYEWCKKVLETYPEILEDHPAYLLCATVNPISTARVLWYDYGVRPRFEYGDEEDIDPFDNYGYGRPRMLDADNLPDFLRRWANRFPGMKGPDEDKPIMTSHRMRTLAKLRAWKDRVAKPKDRPKQIHGGTD